MPKKKPPNKKKTQKEKQKTMSTRKKKIQNTEKYSQQATRRVEGAHPRTDRYRRWRSRAEEDRFASETLLEKREVRKW
jgi:hypothetical protein